jgi:uncharacterized protein (TIGR02246 family)
MTPSLPARIARHLALLLIVFCAPATAHWKAANARVTAAANDPRIAAALAAVDRMDAALIDDDHATFAAQLGPNLVVNNPQNGVSVREAVGQRSNTGLIRYSQYARSVEYAGMLDDAVVLMGEERVIPRGDGPDAGQQVRRRFTDLWKQDGARWVLVLRQATRLGPDAPAPIGARPGAEAAIPGPETLISAFVDAWNAHDASGFTPLFTEQAIWVPVAETRDEGRTAIIQDLAAAHATWARKTTIALLDTPTIGRPAAGVATLFFRVRFLDGKGQPIQGIERALLIVAVQDAGGWRIAAGQLTKESPAPK